MKRNIKLDIIKIGTELNEKMIVVERYVEEIV